MNLCDLIKKLPDHWSYCLYSKTDIHKARAVLFNGDQHFACESCDLVEALAKSMNEAGLYDG